MKSKRASYEIYFPKIYEEKNTLPLLVLLSPSGRGNTYFNYLYPSCNREGWLIAASNDFRNGVSGQFIIPKVENMIEDVCQNYKVNKSNIFIGGFSGGGMGSYSMAQYKPNFFKGLIINAGRIHPEEQNIDLLKSMGVTTVVMISGNKDPIATPSIMNYHKKLLEEAKIKVHFISYESGHSLAPPHIWDKAIKYLSKYFL